MRLASFFEISKGNTEAALNSFHLEQKQRRNTQVERDSIAQSAKDMASNFRAADVKRIEAERERDQLRMELVELSSNCKGYANVFEERNQLRKELAESQSWVKASMESAAIASSTIARLERERDQLREWVAREIQQMPDMSGGVPFAWEKLDDQSHSMWRMRADEAASRLAAQGLERNAK